MPTKTLRALLACTAAALATTATAQEEEMLHLTVALAVLDANFNTTTGSIFRIADEMGYFERAGVDVEFVSLDGTPAAVAALHSGDVDLADISIDAAIRLRAENDVPVRGVIATSVGTPFLIAGKEEIATVSDLAGHSFAIADNGSLDHTLTLAVLRSLGLDPDGPAFVAIGAPDVRVQALAAGQVDATTVSYGTWSSIEGTAGLHVIMQPDEFGTHAPAMGKFVAGLESTLAEKSEAVQRFTEAMIEAARAMQADSSSWVEAAVAARPDLTRQGIEGAAAINAGRWCINGCMSEAMVTGAIDFIYANPEFAEVPVLGIGDLADLSFTTRALEDLGVAGGTGLDARN